MITNPCPATKGQMTTDEELKVQLDKVDWPVQYGVVKVQIRHGSVSLITIERTIKGD